MRESCRGSSEAGLPTAPCVHPPPSGEIQDGALLSVFILHDRRICTRGCPQLSAEVFVIRDRHTVPLLTNGQVSLERMRTSATFENRFGNALMDRVKGRPEFAGGMRSTVCLVPRCALPNSNSRHQPHRRTTAVPLEAILLSAANQALIHREQNVTLASRGGWERGTCLTWALPEPWPPDVHSGR